MKLRLNLSLRRALLAALAAVCTLSSTATAGVVDGRYDLQYYLDFCRNKGMFAAGATNIEVFFKDGTSIETGSNYADNSITLMPNMDSYGEAVSSIYNNQISSNGGTNLVSSQFVYGAKHVHAKLGNSDVAFLSENASSGCVYDSANLDTFGTDSALQRLTKLVTEAAYTPMATDEFMQTITTNGTRIFRIGNGGTWSDGSSISTGGNSLGGVVNLSVCWQNAETGEWYLEGWARKSGDATDTLTPLDIGTYFGDSGSPCFAWDDENNQFVFVGAIFAGGCQLEFPNWYLPRYNYQQAVNVMDKYTLGVSITGTDTIYWSESDAASGKGTLTQGSATIVEYTGKGTDNTLGDSLGLTFSTEDTSTTRELQLQGNVNMGAGALTFENGKWRLTELADYDFTLHSAGFEIKKGAELTWELTGDSSQEIRKVGEGTLTIAGSGNNESTLVVGGGTTVYEVSRDEAGNITGCSLGNAGETRLNRTGGYAASSVRLEGGVAIIVLMGDEKDAGGQFKTNSTAGDTFSFGNAGGLLNLNGHDLTWGVINQDGSGTGARIGNKTPLGEEAPGKATFTYTGTGTFQGCFVDEGAEGAQLAVVYNNDTEGATWKLTGNSTNAGGFTVQAGTMVLEGTRTPHVLNSVADDWTYASMETSTVEVKEGARFQLSHHALMKGDVNVAAGGSLEINQTANTAFESISGSLRQDMEALGITSLMGNVTLNGTATMTVNANSPVTTTMKGNVYVAESGSDGTGSVPGPPSPPTASFVKNGSGTFVLDGNMGYVNGTVAAGGLVVTGTLDFDAGYHTIWTIGEQGFLAVKGTNADTVAAYLKSSSGVLALTADQATAISLSYNPNLYVGAYGEEAISYGKADTALAANSSNQWLLGGGTGTLNVLFLLEGDADLIIGNDYSSGTVHLANTKNTLSGDIYIKGTGNMLTYAEGALGDAKVALTYGNTLALHDAEQISILKEGVQGVLALTKSQDLDISNLKTSIASVGDLTYTGTLTAGDTYRFGGKGNLTLATDLSSASTMQIDGQGNTGSSVTLARAHAYTGDITVGGGLKLETPNSSGSIALHAGHADSLASVKSLTLQKGATLHTDGHSRMTVQNLTAQAGSSIQNIGQTDTTLLLNVTENTSTSIADGVLAGTADGPGIALVKTGKGTLTMGTNNTWNGGLRIEEGKVSASITGNGSYGSSCAIGSADNVIYIDQQGTLSISGVKQTGHKLAGTEIVHTIQGTGTLEFSTGGSAFFSTQSQSFDGTVRLTGNTRVYLGSQLDYNGSGSGRKDTLSAVQNATMEVTAGSQVRITSALCNQYATRNDVYTNFIISGSGFAGSYAWEYRGDSLITGALAIDFDSTVYGNVTLANDATISSSSNGLGSSGSKTKSCYGIKGWLGGTIRGQILGEGKTLTIGGNEGMTFTADSANTYGNLVIANGNGNNDDKFALRLNGGKATSQTSTALGTGEVILGNGLILRLAGTGTANQTDVTYTYANNISAGEGSTLQSYNITNRLTGTVSMSGDTLNLATANGGVLDLAGGISGSGTLNITANSKVMLGAISSTAETPSFAIAAGAGADITLQSANLISGTTISGTDTLSLSMAGTGDYTLGGIVMNKSGETASQLTLNFDFTNVPVSSDATSWNTLSSSITADSTVVELSLNMFNDIKSGTYTLATGELGGAYTLADTLNGRLKLAHENGALVLTVGTDNRLYWKSESSTHNWNSTDANWHQESSGGDVTSSNDDYVVLDSTGVATGNSATSRETITLTEDISVNTIAAKDSYYEVTGNKALSANKLVVGNKGNLKLSNTGSNTFTDGVLVNDATLEVTGGSLTADVHLENAGATIQNATYAGNITATGSGTLTLDTVLISGSRELRFNAGTLSAPNNAVLGGTFTNAPEQQALQVKGMSLAYGAISSSAALDVDTLQMSSCALTMTHAAGTTTEIDTITGNGSLNLNSAGNLNLCNANLWGMELKGGGTTTITGTVKLTYNPLSIGKGTLNLTNGANVSVTRLVAGNTAKNQPSRIYIGTGATLNVTGNNDTDTTSNSFLLAHWGNSASELVLDGGTLNVQNTSLLMGWDSSGRFEVLSGTANLKGIRFSTARGFADTLILGSAETGSGRINLGSNGITGIGTNDTVNLGNGTLGAMADYAINGHKAVNLIGTNTGTTFDTAGYTVTVNTALAGAGNLIKTGAGTLLLAGDGTAFSGNITVEGGSLAVNGTGKTVLESAASVLIINGTLDISSLNLNDPDVYIEITAGQTFSLSENASINFGNIAADTEYHIFNFNGASVDGWSTSTLTAEHIIIGGVSLSDMGRVEYTLSENGYFSYSLLGDRQIVWAGGQENASWTQSTGATIWRSEANENTSFVNFDSVAFTSNADLTLDGDIHVKDLTLGESVSLKTNGQLTVHGVMTLGNGFSWDFSGNTTLSFTEAQLKTAGRIVVGDGATLVMTDKQTEANNTSSAFNQVSGTGRVVLNLAADNGVGFNLSGFTGDITVASGRLQVNTSTFNEASTITLAATNSELVFNRSCELKNDVVLGADTTIHVNKPKDGYYDSVISGDILGEDRKLTKAGGSALTLQGRTTLKTLETYSGQVIIDSSYALIEMVDGAMGNTAGGTLKLAEGASLRLTGDVWSRSSTGILLDKGAELALLAHDICIINENSSDTSLKATTSAGKQYSLSESNYEIKNARVVYTGSESATLANKLTNVTVENSISNAIAPANLEDETGDAFYVGSTLTVTNADNTYDGIVAYGGDIMLQNMQPSTSMNRLEIAAGRMVSAYVGSANEETSVITITEQALLSGSSTLNASLTLAAGATLDMYNLDSSAVTLNGKLIFEGTVVTGDYLEAILAGMNSRQSGELTLFTGLESLTINGAEMQDGSLLLASNVFDVQLANLYVNYSVDSTTGGTLSIVNIPEPATTTLGLLALTALAARRRRK